MRTQWLLQKNHPDQWAIHEIASILRERDMTVELVSLKGNAPEMPDVEVLDLSNPIICYGPSFVPRVLQHPDLQPGIFFDPDMFRWSAFRQGWGDLMASNDAVVVPLAEATALLSTEALFVRPDADSKAFDGGIHDEASLRSAIAPRLRVGLLNEASPVVLASPIPIEAEWRTFVVDGVVAGASSYRHAGAGDTSLFVPSKVVDLAEEAASIWRPADIFCLDIGLSGNRYGIIEANCFNASRFYNADVSAVLEAVSSFAEHSYPTSPAPG